VDLQLLEPIQVAGLFWSNVSTNWKDSGGWSDINVYSLSPESSASSSLLSQPSSQSILKSQPDSASSLNIQINNNSTLRAI